MRISLVQHPYRKLLYLLGRARPFQAVASIDAQLAQTIDSLRLGQPAPPIQKRR